MNQLIVQEHFKITIVPQLQQELKSILNFWAKNTVDTTNEGFIAELNGVGEQTTLNEKGAVLNTRLLWTFSAAYNFCKEPVYLKLAQRAYLYIIQHFWDNENGGLFWSVNNNGSVKNGRKQAYAQAFGIYGFSEYYKASGDEESLGYAVELYNLIEANFKDNEFEGYIEALDNNWLLLKDMRLSPKDANEPKSMNTHLHIVEAYTNLYQVWTNTTLQQRIKALTHLFQNKIVDKKTFHFNLFFDMDWTIKSNIISYGHDIEGAWLLNNAVQLIQDEALSTKTKQWSLNIVDATIAEGIDKDGGVFNELLDNCLDTDKHWWPQAEALVGLLDAYQNSNHPKYLEVAHHVWKFILKHIKDKENGEWFWKVDNNGKPDIDSPKVGFWKCPYHNTRALMEAIKRINNNMNEK